MGEPVGLTRKREKNNGHPLNNKSLSYTISNMKHCFQLRHFENEKFSQKYVIEYIILCCNLIYLYIIQLRFIENKYFHS